jgi:TonB family protein
MQVLDAPKPVYPSEPVDKDETIKSPVVAVLAINRDGSVKSVRLKRSCGVRRYDKAVLESLEKWRYNAADESCGERSSTVSVSISPSK